MRLTVEESHHARRVLRLRAGDRIAVFDGLGEEWEGRLIDDSEDRTGLRLEARIEGPIEAPLRVVLFQATSKPERLELVVQKACEIGVGAIHPLQAARGGGAGSAARRERRLHKIALEACKQSGRRVLPLLDPFEALPAVDDPSVIALLLDPESDSPPIGELLRGSRPAAVWIAVGPEGGFSAAEREQAVESGWTPVRLGPRTLRTETAGIVAATIVLHRLGDLGAA